MKKILTIVATLLFVSTLYAQNVVIPDANFKDYLINNPLINTNSDSEIQETEAIAYTGALNISDLGIESLQGIEAFINLDDLNARDNNLGAVDVSQNTLLTSLNLRNTDLTALDVSSNPLLTYLELEINDIDTLDLSNNTDLRDLLLQGNPLKTLDLSNNTSLRSLRIHSTDLDSIDLSAQIDLRMLLVGRTSIQTIDLSNNIELRTFWAFPVNNLNSLDVSNNINLSHIALEGGNIKTLDLSRNVNLDKVTTVGLDSLQSMDLRNGNNTAITSINLARNPALFCVDVDDIAYSETNWTAIDQGLTFSRACTPRPFITTWKTDNPGISDDNQIRIPTEGTGYNYTINWGDGETYTNVQGDTVHTYAAPGEYEVQISGDFPRIFFERAGDAEKLIAINQWGDISWTSMNKAFDGCKNMQGLATDAPDLTLVKDISNMFAATDVFDQDLSNWVLDSVTTMRATFFSAKAFNGNIDNWNVENVTTMGSLFSGASAFNRDISNWDVSKVEDFDFMFNSANAFNQAVGRWNTASAKRMQNTFQNALVFDQPLNNWIVDSVTTMSGMFSKAREFNQDLNDWNVENVVIMSAMFDRASKFNGNISDWDVSKVFLMDRMFQFALEFDQDISEWTLARVTSLQSMFNQANSFNQNISGWNVESVNNMAAAFSGASSFDQNLGDWNVSNVTSMVETFDLSGLSVQNYDSLLIGWSALQLQDSVVFDAFNTNYCNGSSARSSIISDFGWDISDAGDDCTLVGFSDLNSLQLSFYPNPVIDFISISETADWVLLSGAKQVGSGTGTEIDMTRLPAGLYFLRIGNNETVKVFKE